MNTQTPIPGPKGDTGDAGADGAGVDATPTKIDTVDSNNVGEGWYK